ncbi:GTPase ObgE, partial [Chloroflexota bacterium]
GGDVVLEADQGVSDLRAFKPKRLYKAAKGENGRGQKKHGKKGEDLVLSVPAGVVALGELGAAGVGVIADLERSGQQAVVARGGRGGLGNVHYVSSTNQASRIAQKGEAGEGFSITLELRLIADVGIIGYPNVGKSTLLSAASAAKPRIADYPFTTREPVLGVVEVGQQIFVLAEIPGLIDGAHRGRGLGHDFLRHITRTRVLIHVVDGSSVSPLEDMIRVNTELSLFDSTLTLKPQLVVVNKIDLPQVQARLDEIKAAFADAGTPLLCVSAETGEGVGELMAEVVKVLNRVAAERKAGKQISRAVFRPQPKSSGARVYKDGDTFAVEAPALERIIARVDMTNPEVRWQIRSQLDRLGVSKALEKAGVKPGNKVRCGHAEWEW